MAGLGMYRKGLWTQALQQGRRTLLVVHALLAWPLVFMAGAALWPHLRRRIRHPSLRGCLRARAALGLLSAFLMAMLVVTGVGLLYAPAAWRGAIEGLHLASGLMAALPLVLHLFMPARPIAPARSRPESRTGC